MNKREILLLILAILGALDLAWRGVGVLSALFPRLFSLQARVWHVLADTFAIASFRKKAVATRVEEVLNQSAFDLQQYLPAGWVKRARIQWVRNPNSPELRDGDIVLRVRPQKNEDHNLMQALLIYFNKALFPESRDVLPQEIISAVALAITRSAIEGRHQYLLKEFDNGFLKSEGKGKEAILNHFGDCVRLNEYGLLMGPFIRELDHVATGARFGPDRAELPQTIRGIMDHMLGFQPFLRPNKPEEDWWYVNGSASYRFILVSKPPEFRPGIQNYVKRAQDGVNRGIQRVYIIGRNEERDFVTSVLRAVLSVRQLKGLEQFALFRDYRGDPNGIGALLGLDSLLARLDLSHRPIESLRIEASQANGSNTPEVVPPTGDVSPNGVEIDVAAESDLSKITEDIIIRLSDYDGEWVQLGEVGNALRDQVREFTPQRYGGRNLFSVLKKLDSLEFDVRGSGPIKSIYVRLKTGDHKTTTPLLPVKVNIHFTPVLDVIKRHVTEGEWIFLGSLGSYLRKEIEGFEPARFGATTLHDLVAEIPDLEIDERGEGHTKTYVRIKQ